MDCGSLLLLLTCALLMTSSHSEGRVFDSSQVQCLVCFVEKQGAYVRTFECDDVGISARQHNARATGYCIERSL